MRCRAADRELIHRVRSRGKLDCRVVGVYRKAANLLDPEGRIITAVLHRPEPVPGGFSLLLPEETPWPESLKTLCLCWEGEEAPGILSMDEHTREVDFTLPPAEAAACPRQTQVLANFLAEHCPPGGIASLLEQGGWSCIPPREPADGDRGGEVLANFLGRLSAGTLTPDTPILGLGIGLTPSSDDFVLGLLAVFHRYGNPLGKRVEACVQRQLSGTTPVSAEMLRGGLEGRYPLYISRLLKELERGEILPREVLEEFLDHGHSSGTDMLYGILWGLKLNLAGAPSRQKEKAEGET